MVAHIFRLRIAQQVAPLRTRRRGSAIVVALLVVLAAAAAARGAVALRATSAETLDVAAVLGGSLIALAFFLAPFGSSRSDPLDPAAFALLPLSPIALTGATMIAALTSLPLMAVIAVDTAAASSAVALGRPVVAVIAGVAAHALTCALAARLGYALAVRVRVGGRTREGATIVGILGVAVVIPAAAYALSASWELGAPTLMVSVAHVAALTPIGAAPALLAAGGPATIAIVIATLAVAITCWALIVRHALTSPPRSAQQQEAGLGWLGLLPTTATGVIAARSMIYWSRDVRYLANVAIIPIAGLVPVLPLLIAGVPVDVVALIPLPIIAAFLGWTIHNDLAYDSEAIWLHVVTSVRGVADRIGRLLPIVVIAIPMLSITIAVTAAVAGAWEHLGALIGVALALTLSGIGLSSISSAAAAYPVARPGDSPFRQPQRAGGRGVLAPAVVLLGTFGVSVPTLIAAFEAVMSRTREDVDALWIGAGTGVGALVFGILIGAVVFQRRGHRLIEIGQTR